MKLIISIAFILFSIKISLANDTTWSKAIDISEKSKNYRAKNVYTTIYELNKDGSIASNQEIYQKIRLGKEIKYDTIKVIKDGKDITQEALKKRKEQKKRDFFTEENDIFSNKVQNKISYEKIGNQIINKNICYVYSYKYDKNDKEKYQGKAWLNSKTGEPNKIEYTMNPLPMGLKDISILYNYESQNNKTYIKTIKVNGEASFILFKKIFKLNVDLSDFKEIN
ncbi:MAG: hypothetical protein U0354_18935 [Candidatus Sericytochromatia bacterium]